MLYVKCIIFMIFIIYLTPKRLYKSPRDYAKPQKDYSKT